MFNHPKTQILIYENDGIPLTQIYNLGYYESENDIVVFMHDDLVLETPDITPKINELFKKPVKKVGIDKAEAIKAMTKNSDKYGYTAD
jgi:hypothetical protein